jgi:hypothetical protein
MAKLPTFSSRDFDWRASKGTATLSRIALPSFPQSFFIKSWRTGEVMLFLPDAATMEANEFFDGEAAAYFTPGGNVQVLVYC